MNRQRSLNEYLDGRMSPPQRAAFEAQLALDPALAAELAETQRVLTLLRSVPTARPPDHLTRRVMQQVRELPVPHRRPAVLDWLSRLLQPQRLALATCVAAVVVVVSVVAQPKDVRLAPSDQAFIEQCLADYHAETSKLTPRTTVDLPADPAVDALGSGLR